MNARRDIICIVLDHCGIRSILQIPTMQQQHNTDHWEALADSDAVTTVTCAAVIVIDDSWLEALLDNLALAQLRRLDCMDVLKKLEEFEYELDRSASAAPTHEGVPPYQIIVGDHFDGPLNAHDMRAPDAMTAENVLETIDRAARYFVTHGHSMALKQLVFFISGNLEEVLTEEEADDI